MSASYDNDAIKGEQLEVLATEIAKRLLSDGSVVAEALNSLAIRLESVEHGLSEIGNAGLGERGLVSLMTSNASDSENFAATPKSVKTAYDSLNSTKQNKLSTAQQNAVDSGITSAKRTSYDNHIADNDIHVTKNQKDAWDDKAEKNGYYPDMSVGGSDKSEVSAAVKDYNDSSSIIKIGYAGASLSSCTTLAAFTKLDGGTNAIKDIPVDLVKVGGSIKADNADYSTKSGFAVNFSELNGDESNVAITDALPRFFSKEFGIINLFALQENNVANLFNISIQQAGFLFWTVQLEDVPVDMVITFSIIKSKRAWGDGEEHSSAALYVKSGNSTVSFITQYSYNVDDSGNRWYYLTALPRHSYSGAIRCKATCFRLTGAVQRFGGPWG